MNGKVLDPCRSIDRYLSIGIVITIPPMTSLRLKSRLGLFGCALWHPMHDWLIALSAYTV